MRTADDLCQRAREIADQVFFPSASTVDQTGVLPREWFDLLAADGFYGVAAGLDDGGLDAGFELAGELVETFASGCLSAAFVWIQHHGVVRGVAGSTDPAVRKQWLGPLVSGECRAGIALAGLRPGPDQLRVRRTPQGWRVDGTAPWLTGWDHIDVVYLAAVDEKDVVHFLLVDAASGPALHVDRPRLMAVQASATVQATLTGHLLAPDRLVSTMSLADWTAGNAAGSTLNGFLALGVVARAARLTGTEVFDAELTACRTELSTADPAGTPRARANASLLAHRASAALAVHTGSRFAYAGSHAERLLREAAFLLVFGSRPPIRDVLLERLQTDSQSDSHPVRKH